MLSGLQTPSPFIPTPLGRYHDYLHATEGKWRPREMNPPAQGYTGSGWRSRPLLDPEACALSQGAGGVPQLMPTPSGLALLSAAEHPAKSASTMQPVQCIPALISEGPAHSLTSGAPAAGLRVRGTEFTEAAPPRPAFALPAGDWQPMGTEYST